MAINETLIRPSALKPGSEVALVSPINLPPQQYRADQAIADYVSAQGLRPTLWISSTDTPKHRVELFNAAVYDGARGLLPIAGNRFGEDVLDRIDYNALEKMRPVYCTFSAASALLLAIHFRSNLGGFYGPHVSFMHHQAFNREGGYTRASFWNMLQRTNNTTGLSPIEVEYAFKWQEDNLVLRNLFASGTQYSDIGSEPIPFIPKKTNQSSPRVEGRLLPAFLQSLEKVIAGGLKIDFSGRIVVVESDETSFGDNLAVFKKIAQSANLKDASAIVLASFVTYKQNPPNSQLQAELYDPAKVQQFTTDVSRIVGDNVPVIYGFPMGHLRYKITVPMGPQATLDTETGDITLHESPFYERK